MTSFVSSHMMMSADESLLRNYLTRFSKIPRLEETWFQPSAQLNGNGSKVFVMGTHFALLSLNLVGWLVGQDTGNLPFELSC